MPATSALDSVYSVPCISSASGETRNKTLVRSAAARPLLAHSFAKLRIAPVCHRTAAHGLGNTAVARNGRAQSV